MGDLRQRKRRLRKRVNRKGKAIERLRGLVKWTRGKQGLGFIRERAKKLIEAIKRSRRVDNAELREVIRRLRERRGIPSWLPTEYADKWRQPWTVEPGAQADTNFKRVIWEHGFASPNFTRREMGGQDRHPLGCPVPESLRGNCQFHSFKLERVRHRLGDKAMRPYSAYRCPAHNQAVGGASQSQHMNAWATDWDSVQRDALGGEAFDNAMEQEFAHGGRGYQGFVGGPIRHVDNGPERSWVYA